MVLYLFMPPQPSAHPPPVCLGIGRCEEGIYKNRGQILPAAEAGRAAQDGHGQSHRPLFVQGGDWDDYTFCLLTRAITKTLPNENGQISQNPFHTLEYSPLWCSEIQPLSLY